MSDEHNTTRTTSTTTTESDGSPTRVDMVREQAVANSSPDFNQMMMAVIRRMLGGVSVHPFERGFKTLSGTVLLSLMLLFVVGLPVINGSTLLIQVLADSDAAGRSFQLEMFKLQTDVEIKKLDRTLLGDGALKTLQGIAERVDAIGKKQDETAVWQSVVTAQVEGLVANVGKLTSRQNSLAAQQAQTQAQIRQQAQGSPARPAVR